MDGAFGERLNDESILTWLAKQSDYNTDRFRCIFNSYDQDIKTWRALSLSLSVSLSLSLSPSLSLSLSTPADLWFSLEQGFFSTKHRPQSMVQWDEHCKSFDIYENTSILKTFIMQIVKKRMSLQRKQVEITPSWEYWSFLFTLNFYKV